MKCSSLMKADLECCRHDATVEEAAERMKKRNIGFMPVCDEGGAAIGTVTDRDLAIRVLGERRDAPFTLVEEVMTPEVVSCSPEDELEVAERLMEQYRKSRIVLVDDRGRPVGVISLSDVALVEKGVRAAEILQAVVSREAQVRVA
jgi:CBS domain-containing protein